MNGEKIINLAEPTRSKGAATKGYVDVQNEKQDISINLKAEKTYVDSTFLKRDGTLDMTGNLNMNNKRITEVGTIIMEYDNNSPIYMNGSRIFSLPDPNGSQQPVTVRYLQRQIANIPNPDLSSYLKRDGSVGMTGILQMGGNATTGIGSSSQDNAALAVGGARSTYLPLSGGRSMQGYLNMGGYAIRNIALFVEDDSSQEVSDAQRNYVINYGYFKDQRGDIERQINQVAYDALNRKNPDPMEDNIDMANHSIVRLKDPSSSDSFYAANVNYINKTISDNNAVINTNIENKIQDAEYYLTTTFHPINVFKYLMDDPVGEIILKQGLKGIGKINKNFHIINKTTYHVQLTLPKTSNDEIYNYSFDIQINQIPNKQRYSLVFELYHSNTISDIKTSAFSKVAIISQTQSETITGGTRSLINFEKNSEKTPNLLRVTFNVLVDGSQKPSDVYIILYGVKGYLKKNC